MKIKSPLPLSIISSISILGAFSCKSDNHQEEKPNIIFILADDLGYKDLGCYGSAFYETPNIDALANQGMRFTRFYSPSAVCSPTRASILTGKTPARHGITDWTGPEEWHPKGKLETPGIKEHLKREELTLAEALSANGYCSMYIGKWHLGGKEHYPDKHGFDFCMGTTNAGAPPSFFYPYIRENWDGTGWPVDIEDLSYSGTQGEYLTDRLTEESIRFLNSHKQKPFFLFLAHYAVHKPLEAKQNIADKYREKIFASGDSVKDSLFISEKNNSYTKMNQDHSVYAAMIESLDESVGRIIDFLKTNGLDKNTVVIFTSDNGGFSSYSFPLPGETVSLQTIPTSNAPLRAGKGWYYEGGIRVLTIISWPEKIKENSVSDELLIGMDFYPTLLEISGAELNPIQHRDGISFKSLLVGEDFQPHRSLFWHYPHYHSSGQDPASAIIRGKYKLIHFIEDDQTELYNLEKDTSEKNNLTEELPAIREELVKELRKWRKDTGAEMPGTFSEY